MFVFTNVHELFYVLFPIHTACAVVACQFNEEVLSCKEGLKLNFNLNVFGLGVLVELFEVIVLNELSGTFVVAEEVVDGLLKFSFDL